MIIKAINFNYSKMETSTTNYVREVCEGTTYESAVGVLDVPDSDIEPVPPMLERIAAVDRALYSPGSIVVFDLETTGICTFTIY